MKKKIFFYYFIICILFSGCINAQNKPNSSGLVEIHSFSYNNKYLGSLFGNKLNNELYNRLFIINKTSHDTLYSIIGTKYSNTYGKEEAYISEENFYGYSIKIAQETYFTLELFWLDNLNTSGADPITIEWNIERSCFEILKVP